MITTIQTSSVATAGNHWPQEDGLVGPMQQVKKA